MEKGADESHNVALDGGAPEASGVFKASQESLMHSQSSETSSLKGTQVTLYP